MSEAERAKWDARYAAGAYRDRNHACRLLTDWTPKLPVGRALDVACGAGRNAIFLASRGFTVDAIDISGVALEQAAARATALHLQINWRNVDLDVAADWPVDGPFDLIVLVRYVNLALYPKLIGTLAPAGVLLTEQHLVSGADVIGPRNSAFRLRPGSLRSSCSQLHLLHDFEGLVEDPDGRTAALAQIVGRKRDPVFDSGATEPA